MAIQQRLHTKLVQKLILTPSLQQAIKLLPMSTLELSDLLNQEMVENPLLEEVPTEELQPAEQQQTDKAEAEKPAAEKTDSWDDADYEYFFGDYLDDGYRSRTPSEVKELPPIENTLSTTGSLSDHLLWQLSLQTSDDQLREIGGAIIGNLDDDGYLVASVEEIAAMGEWSVADVERALQHVQTFDPIGVAARDLQECLWLQIRQFGFEGTPAEKIVTEHLRLLQNHQVPEIARKLGMSIDDLKEHIEIIRNLDPKPGSRYNPTQSQYVIPDVYIVKVEDQYVAALNEEGLPQLRISPVYRRLLDKSGGESNDETRAYVKDKFRSALWLIKSVDQRQKTIHKVATSIINFQKRVPRSRHRVPQAARPPRRGQRHRHARVDGQPRREQQVHAHAARRVRDEVLLPQRHQQLVRRERLVGHDQAAHPEDHRERRSAKALERFEDREHPPEGRIDARPADDRKVPRGAEDPDVEPTEGAFLVSFQLPASSFPHGADRRWSCG